MLVVLLALLCLIPAPAWNQAPDVNVNSRYTIESVEFPGKYQRKLSPSLRSEFDRLAGEKFNQDLVDRLSKRIRRELRGYSVMQKITKGTRPESIRVVYEVLRAGRQTDVVLPRLVYHSRENFSFGADVKLQSGGHELSMGILTDNDRLMERYSGLRGGYQRSMLDGRLHAGFTAESWRAQWNPAVSSALVAESGQDETAGIYRTRLHVSPGLSAEIVPGLTLFAGVSFQRFQTQFPAARFESSNALVSSLRIQRRFEPSGPGKHTVEAGYHLRAATRSLGSDFAYSRHAFDARYGLDYGDDHIAAAFTAGYLTGRAPLFDRFILGNSTTLRGYNKYDVAPLGGGRMAHGSIDYRHKWVRVVYDTGAVYDRGRGSGVLHSLAAGITTGAGRDSVSLLVAFPLKEGRAEPVFILGMNF